MIVNISVLDVKVLSPQKNFETAFPKLNILVFPGSVISTKVEFISDHTGKGSPGHSSTRCPICRRDLGGKENCSLSRGLWKAMYTALLWKRDRTRSNLAGDRLYQ